MNTGRQGASLTPGTRILVSLLFVCVIGLLIGFAGLIGDWEFARKVGVVALVVLAAVFVISSELKTETLNRLLPGRTTRLKDDKNA